MYNKVHWIELKNTEISFLSTISFIIINESLWNILEFRIFRTDLLTPISIYFEDIVFSLGFYQHGLYVSLHLGFSAFVNLFLYLTLETSFWKSLSSSSQALPLWVTLYLLFFLKKLSACNISKFQKKVKNSPTLMNSIVNCVLSGRIGPVDERKEVVYLNSNE